MDKHVFYSIAAAALLLCGGRALAESIPALRCQEGKNHEAGKYALCLHDAEKRLVLTGDPTKYNKAVAVCESKFAHKWQLLTDAATAAGTTCLEAPLTAAQFKVVIDAHVGNIVTALGGGGLADCPSDLAACQNNLSVCEGQKTGGILQTGQTRCYDTSGTTIPCAGTGQDGELEKGLARSYVDNGDGTVTDTTTGLMWEKLSDDGSIHDTDNTYTWTAAVTTKVAALNTIPCFAGYCDWRLPNRNELESLADSGRVGPAIDPAYTTGCATSCTVTTCSCTRTDYAYWASTTSEGYPDWAWIVAFYDGAVRGQVKTDSNHVRAVRGGQ